MIPGMHRRYDSRMPLTPQCPQPEWLDRARQALTKWRPEMDPDELAAVVNGHLWEEACDLTPEEAVEIYVTEHPE